MVRAWQRRGGESVARHGPSKGGSFERAGALDEHRAGVEPPRDHLLLEQRPAEGLERLVDRVALLVEGGGRQRLANVRAERRRLLGDRHDSLNEDVQS